MNLPFLFRFCLWSVALLGVTGLGAQVFPGSPNLWNNPAFQERVRGSFGAHTEFEPKLTEADAATLQAATPFFDSNPNQAIRLIQGQMTPDSSAALHFIIGTLEFQQGNDTGAVRAYREALRKFPSFLRVYRNLGFTLVRSGQLDEAIPVLLKTVELGGADGNVYGLLGYAYLQQERYGASLNAYNFAILHDPENKDWFLGKLRCLMQFQDYQEALGIIDELIRRSPREGELYLHQANAFLGQDRVDDAAANLEIARRLGFATPESLFLAGDIFSNTGLTEMAATRYIEAMEAIRLEDLTAERTERAVRALLDQGAYAEGEQVLDFALERADQFSEGARRRLLNYRAQFRLGAGDQEGAMEALEEIVAVDPLNGAALLTLGGYYFARGDLSEAIFHFERAALVEDSRPDALIEHARCLVQLRAYEEAAALLRESVELRPRVYVADYLRAVEQAAGLR